MEYNQPTTECRNMLVLRASCHSTSRSQFESERVNSRGDISYCFGPSTLFAGLMVGKWTAKPRNVLVFLADQRVLNHDDKRTRLGVSTRHAVQRSQAVHGLPIGSTPTHCNVVLHGGLCFVYSVQFNSFRVGWSRRHLVQSNLSLV
jgi:hypothetical protein